MGLTAGTQNLYEEDFAAMAAEAQENPPTSEEVGYTGSEEDRPEGQDEIGVETASTDQRGTVDTTMAGNEHESADSVSDAFDATDAQSEEQVADAQGDTGDGAGDGAGDGEAEQQQQPEQQPADGGDGETTSEPEQPVQSEPEQPVQSEPEQPVQSEQQVVDGGDGSGGTASEPESTYDPDEHTVTEVKQYFATASPEEIERVKEAERNGQNRSGIVNYA